MIEALVTITESYQYSRELALFLTRFEKCLPEAVRLFLFRRADDDASTVLTDAMKDRLAKGDLPEYFLLVREPSLLMGKNLISILIRCLMQNPSIDCVLPSDFRGIPGTDRSPDYLSQRGFEHFIDGVSSSSELVVPYDGRDPFLFVLRSRALEDSGTDIFRLPAQLGKKTAISPQAYIHPFFDYYNEKREEVAQLVPSSVESVLDIGCTRGAFGDLLKTRLKCHVTGMEMNPVEGEKARRVLDEVIIGDASGVAAKGPYDCVTCLDVIEHFEDPSRLLQRIRNEFLADRGWLVLSVPNVGHWSIVTDLLAGCWEYLPVGILCNTHLRFFTRTSIIACLEDNGFRIVSMDDTRMPLSETLYQNLKMLSDNGMDVDFKSLEVISYHILAEKM